jgi:hypothetical protein
VSDENGRAANAHAGELASQAVCIATRVDYDCFRRGITGPDDVTVRSDRAYFVSVHGEAHGRLSLTAP